MANSVELQRAQAFLDAGRPEEARRLVHAHLARHPDDPEAMHLAARCAINLDDAAGALEWIGQALQRAPDDAHNHVVAAYAHAIQGDPDRARDAADQALRLAPDHAIVHSTRVELDAESGRIDESTWECDRAMIRLDPESPDVWTTHGRLLQATGDAQGAVDAARKALQLNPEYLPALRLQSVALLDARETAQSAEVLLDAARLSPADAHVAGALDAIARACAAALSLWLTVAAVLVGGCILAAGSTFDGWRIAGVVIFLLAMVRLATSIRNLQRATRRSFAQLMVAPLRDGPRRLLVSVIASWLGFVVLVLALFVPAWPALVVATVLLMVLALKTAVWGARRG